MSLKNWFKFVLTILIFSFTVQSCKSKDKTMLDGSEKIYYNSKETDSDYYRDNKDITSSRHNAITDAVKRCSPAIVGINVTEVVKVQYQNPFGNSFFDDPFFREFFGDQYSQRFSQQYQVQALGSGFIISPDGYILTNHHVAGNASKIIVTTEGGKKYDAEIIGSDKTSDVALLKIKADNLSYLRLANSDETITGEWVIAFGNPFGLFDLNAKPTVTVGVVSNIGVSFTQDDRVYKGMIQTDAAISSGNSGGPLVDATGNVIGMNTVIFSTSQSRSGAGSIGIGFAIPINRIKEVIDNIKNNKKFDRNFYIGMQVREIDDQVARYLGIEKMDGVVVVAIERNSPAEEAGFEPGDIITAIDGNKITRMDDYSLNVNDAYVGKKLSFMVLRDKKETVITMTLKQRRR